ncbi:MAG: tetratricopeptide repeat protein [bacterium]|nr:MAG: tetratricopeptide repeat protein [bacterium]
MAVVSLAGVGGFSCRSKEQALYEQAMAALDDGLSGAAVEYLTTFLVRYPDSPLVPEIIFQRGTIYDLYQSRYIEAIMDFRELLDRFPQNEHAFAARRSIAELLETKIRDCRRAIVEYQRLIDDFETVVEDDLFQYRIASCFYELLNFEQAKLEFYQLINKYPASALVDDAYYQIANILQTQGALGEAEKAYTLYLARYPEGEMVLDARFNLAATLEEMEHLEEALELYNRIFPVYANKEAITWRIEKVRKRMESRGR